MRGNGAISGLLFMGVLFVLGTMGLVYGSWSESLNINGNVQTGTVNVFIFDDNIPDELNSDPKGVAACNQAESVTGGGSGAVAGVAPTPPIEKNDKVTVSISNAFPGYQCHFWTTVVNAGTLPVAVVGTLKDVPAGITVVSSADTDKKGDCEEAQLPPGGETFCDWTVTVTKAAAQDTKYSFGVNITATLLNKPIAD